MKKFLGVFGVALLTQACGFEIVDTGFRGIETRFGEVQGEPLPEGFHWYNPMSSSIREISVREEKLEGVEPSFTRDTQRVDVGFTITYYPKPEKIGVIFKERGLNWDEKTVKPLVLQALKDVVGRYVADDLVSKREEARNAAFTELKGTLDARDVVVTALSFTNLDFDDAYEKAVEAKVVAIQRAAESKNKTVEVEEQAKQKVIAAEAEAKSMTIRSQALAQNKGLAEYEAVLKWNGALPQYMMGGSALPFLSLPGASK